MRAKIKFLRSLGAVVYSVTEQDERCYDVMHDNVRVVSSNSPEISRSDDMLFLFLRGENGNLDTRKTSISMSESEFSALLDSLKKFSPEISVDVIRIPLMSKVKCDDGRVHTIRQHAGSFFRCENGNRINYDRIEDVVELFDERKVPSFYALSVRDRLEWRKILFLDKQFVDSVDGGAFDKSCCIATKDINMKKFARCSACGEIMRNTETEIQKHLMKGSNIESCKRCDCYSCGGGAIVSIKQKRINGIDCVIETRRVAQKCKRSFNSYSIENEFENKNSFCMYRLCTREKINTLEPPEIPKFDKFPTIDMLKEKYRGKTIGDFDNAMWSSDMHAISVPINFCDGLFATVTDGVITQWTYAYRRRRVSILYCDADGCFYEKRYSNYFKTDSVPQRFAQKIEKIICASESSEN